MIKCRAAPRSVAFTRQLSQKPRRPTPGRALGFADRLAFAREGGSRLHPEIAENTIVPLNLGLSIAWHKVPFQLGGWAEWSSTSAPDQTAYRRLLGPDGRFYVIGDQVSPLPGWQEGAMMSAEYVVRQLTGQLREAVPATVIPPDSREVTQGSY